MSYLDRTTSYAAGGVNNDAIQAMQNIALAPHRQLPSHRQLPYYRLQYPAIVTNEAGWEVQCLAEHAGWVNKLLDEKRRAVVFGTRKAAQEYMDNLEHDADLEYRVYPSFKGVSKKLW